MESCTEQVNRKRSLFITVFVQEISCYCHKVEKKKKERRIRRKKLIVQGECKRGEECPYRHEKPTDPDDPLSKQNIKDRYYGQNDPVAEKIMNRAKVRLKRPVNGSSG